MAKFKTWGPKYTFQQIRRERGRMKTVRQRSIPLRQILQNEKALHDGGVSVEQNQQSSVELDQPTATPFVRSREKQVGFWESMLDKFVYATIENEAPVLECKSIPGRVCENEPVLRCRDCGPMIHYCIECFQAKHDNIGFHLPDIYHEKRGYEPASILTEVALPQHDCTSTAYTRVLRVWDHRGRMHTANVNFCGCEEESTTLIRNRLWPSTPQLPQVAFHFQLLDWWEALQLEGHLATNAFCNTVRWMNRDHPKHVYSSLYKQLVQDTCDMYRHFKYLVRNRGVTESEEHSCPVCPKESGHTFVSMDACFSLVKKRKDASNIAPLHDNKYFLNQDEVDVFVEDYGIKDKNPDKDCSDFSAGDKVRSVQACKKLDITAVFGASCRHEMPLAFVDLRHGERFSYPLYLMRHLQQNLGPNVTLTILYDIACKLAAHIKVHSPDLKSIELAVPVFHIYGHKAPCQILMNPRRLSDFGLTDGECMERLWSYLGKFAKITKEMTTGRRRDLLIDGMLHYRTKKLDILEITLCQKLEKAVKLLQVCQEKLEEAKKNYAQNDVNETEIQNWFDQENCEAQARQRSNKHSWTWEERYVDMIDEHQTVKILLVGTIDEEEMATLSAKESRLEENLKKTEKSKKVSKRWKKNSKSYISAKKGVVAKKRSALLKQMHSKARDILYLNGLRAKYTDGQAVAKRLAKQQNTAASILRRYLRQLTSLSTDHPSLEYKDVSRPDAPVYQDCMSQLSASSSVPHAVKREIVDVWLMSKRAAEEIFMVKEEMARLLAHKEAMYRETTLAEESVSADNWNRFQAGLLQIRIRKKHLLKQEIDYLKKLFSSCKDSHGTSDSEFDDLEHYYFEELTDEDNSESHMPS